ncbi:hypothetical protein HZB03_04475 [Candidatus Woesearchaeota archaeon]|nr:hypothetical protein [Candidatus Woesearchaeota archaeon]
MRKRGRQQSIDRVSDRASSSPPLDAEKIKDEIAQIVSDHLTAKYQQISVQQLLDILAAKPSKEAAKEAAQPKQTSPTAEPVAEHGLPVVLFATEKLSGLEITVKYIKEELNKSITEIGALLNRSPKTIWTTYSIASKKVSGRFDIQALQSDRDLIAKLRTVASHVDLEKINVPFSVIANRNLSVLESITQYLRDELHLSLNQISVLLHRDNRTIWTVYHRAQKKMSTHKQGVGEKT